MLKKLLMVSLAATAVPAAFGEAPKAAPAKPAPARSVFVMPTSAHAGRDPFFPESTRPYEGAVAAKRTVETSALSVKGISVDHGQCHGDH